VPIPVTPLPSSITLLPVPWCVPCSADGTTCATQLWQPSCKTVQDCTNTLLPGFNRGTQTSRIYSLFLNDVYGFTLHLPFRLQFSTKGAHRTAPLQTQVICMHNLNRYIVTFLFVFCRLKHTLTLTSRLSKFQVFVISNADAWHLANIISEVGLSSGRKALTSGSWIFCVLYKWYSLF